MARQLWLLRHGEAVPHGSVADEQRALTARGREQAAAAGAALAALGVRPVLVAASPKVRAWDTAALACEALGTQPVAERRLAAGFDRDAAVDLLAAAGDGEAVLAVGHEPDLGQVVRDLCGARIDLQKGGTAAVALEGTAGGELVVLLRPSELAAIGARPGA